MTFRTCTPLLLCALSVPLPAQTHAATAPQLEDTAPPTASLAPLPASGAPYTLHVVVTDSKGRPIPNLPASAFTLQDNGIPQPLRNVTAAPAPETLILVIDAVNATYTNVAFERDQIGRYLTAGNGTLPQPTSVFVVTDTSLEATSGYTTDGKALNSTLQQKTIGLRDLRRSAGFYGAEERLDISLKALLRVLNTVAARPGHKSVLWISPGWPLLSGPGVELTGTGQQRIFDQVVALSNRMHAANVTLYSLNPLGSQEDVGRTFYYREFVKGVRKPSQAVLGDLGVQVLAEQSGGLVLNGNNDLTKLIEQSATDAAGAYTVTFTVPPTEPGKPYQQLDVAVATPGLKARTAQGLYTSQK